MDVIWTQDLDCPEQYFSDTAQVIVAIDTLLLCAISFLLQLNMVRVTRNFSGWKSDYSYSLLCFISIIATLFYATEFVGHIRFLVDTPRATIDRFFGAMFMACFLAEAITGISLVIHRVVYTAIPFKAEQIFTPTVLKIHIVVLAVYFLTLVAILCSPLAGFEFCPETMDRFASANAPATPVILWLNTLCNYLVGISTITAYTIVIGVLFMRGNITFHSNAEHRMMIQVSLMSTIGLFYFIYWECRHFLNISKVAMTTIYENLSLFYYNAVMLPYLFLNPTFRAEFLKVFHRKRNANAIPCLAITKAEITVRQGANQRTQSTRA